MERFTIQKEHYNVLKRLRKRSERAVVALAILELAFDDIEPKELTETAELAFESMRQSVEKSRNNSGRGGRKNKNRFETDLKPIDNRIETELQPKGNRIETDFFQEKKASPNKETPNEKERSKEKENTQETNTPLKKENITPLFVSPQGEKKNSHADEFFTLYPKYAKDRGKMRADVDYKRLIDEFAKSKYLRSLYTVKQINELYPLIIAGDYRDVEKQDLYAGLNARAERERWYAKRRAQAESEAEKILNRFLQDETFKAIHKRLGVLPCEIGKAEYQAQTGDTKAHNKLIKLTQEQERLKLQLRGIIERNGLAEEDLEPKYQCRKCKDTGFQEDGRACDCYKGV